MVTGWSDAREQGESRFSDGRRTQLSPLKVGGDGRHENTRGQMDEKIMGGGGRDRGEVGVAGVGIAADGESKQESGGWRRRPSVQWKKKERVR